MGNQHGGVAQLGEHLPCKQGVMGSNPIISITQVKRKTDRLDRTSTRSEGRENSDGAEEIVREWVRPNRGLIAQQVRARA